jgi:hypothetical protein
MKKEILIPIILIVLGLIFILINAFIYFTKGNSWFIKKKLKVGALILSLSGILACGSPPKVSCYDQAPSKEYTDSTAIVKRQDSITNTEKQKQVEDSIANVIEGQKKKDSLAKINHRKKKPIPTCYLPAIDSNEQTNEQTPEF